MNDEYYVALIERGETILGSATTVSRRTPWQNESYRWCKRQLERGKHAYMDGLIRHPDAVGDSGLGAGMCRTRMSSGLNVVL